MPGRLLARRPFLRGCLGAVAAGLLAGCGSTPWTTRPARIPRIAYLSPGTTGTSNVDLFREGLRDLGYVEGENIRIDERYAEGQEERFPALARELVGLGPDVIVTAGKLGIVAAREETSTIPIVFATAGDPVAEGFVASLARPGGNVTGLTVLAGNEHAKRLALLKETIPTLSRVGVLTGRTEITPLNQVTSAAPALGVEVVPLLLDRPENIGSLLTGALGTIDGLIQASTTLVLPLVPRIVALAAQHRLPTIYEANNAVRIGGLMLYAPRNTENFRRAALYVDKILKGARPGDIPVEQPTRYDFVVNLKAARALGLTIPQVVLQQATETIE